ncbi:hypothetical protein EG329_007612 [Mollisiaceae sp. DMI_Dod_QoI]|nr:hypothetical protein EG329_007612 [Helotiales sp. DMI_Dod_QoI]
MPPKAEGSAVGKQVKPETPEPATPKPVPKLTPQDTKNKSDDEDDDGDTRMKDPLEFRIKTTRLVKVATPLIFKGKPSEFKVHLAKITIYIEHNVDIFEDDSNKVTFAIFYLEGPAFDYMEIFFRDFRGNMKRDWKPQTKAMFDDFEVYKRCLTKIYSDVDEREEATRIAKKKEGNCYNCGKAGHWAKKCKASKKQTAAIAKKATKAPKERKTEAAGPKGPLEKPSIEKDYQDWERENWQLGESIEPFEEWTKISITNEKYAKYKRILIAEIQGLRNETWTTFNKQEETYY